MPGYSQKPVSGYLENEYASDWPGLVTSHPSSRIPPGACFSCSAMMVNGRLQPQPTLMPIVGSAVPVLLPSLSTGENVCAVANLALPGQQQGFTVIITNLAVYADFQPGAGGTKTFSKLFTFPVAYPRYARFGAQVIGSSLYFSSASMRGVWKLAPNWTLSSATEVEITNPGAGYGSAPTVTMSDGGGNPLTAMASVSAGLLSSIALSGTGQFSAPPLLTLQGGAGGGGGGSSTIYTPSTGVPAEASATQSGSTGTDVVPSAPIYGFTSVVVSVSQLTVNLTASGVFNGGAFGTGVIEFQYSLDSGDTWTTGSSWYGAFDQTFPSQPVSFGIATGSISNLDTLYLRVQATATLGYDSGRAETTGLITAATVTVTGSSGGGGSCGVFQGSAVVVLPAIPSSYQVSEISAPSGVRSVNVSAGGSGYVAPIALFQGGGGTGAQGTAIINSSGQIVGVEMTVLGSGYTSPPTVVFLDSDGTGATANAILQIGQAFIGGDFVAAFDERLLLANVIGGDGNSTSPLCEIIVYQGGSGYQTGDTVDIVGGGGSGATATLTLSGGAVGGITITNPGTGYTSAPQINILSNTGTGAGAFAVLGAAIASSSDVLHPDYVAWSAPNAYGYFDPNTQLAPGGYNQLTEAQGLIAGLSVLESVGYIGHSGGLTEMTPNTSSAETPYSFYPMWSAQEGVVVRYGSMAQYGSLVAFLSEDDAYTMTPNGLQEIGQNIASLLQNAGIWNNGQFPNQGLYGAIIQIEGQKHYLIGISSDDWSLTQGNNVRQTQVFDANLSENSWSQWTYSGLTMTCPIFQSFDASAWTDASSTVQYSRDSWIICAMTADTGSTSPYPEQATLWQLASLNRMVTLLADGQAGTPNLAVQFRTESPSIARILQERRILVEYENLEQLTGPFQWTLNFTLTGQQDPTAQTSPAGPVQNTSATFSQTQNYIPSGTGALLQRQIFSFQQDFGTFAGVCTSLAISSTSPISIVRITQVGDLPKAMVP